MQLEDTLITEPVTDQDAVVQHLGQMIDHVEIRFPRDRRKVCVGFYPGYCRTVHIPFADLEQPGPGTGAIGKKKCSTGTDWSGTGPAAECGFSEVIPYSFVFSAIFLQKWIPVTGIFYMMLIFSSGFPVPCMTPLISSRP